MSLMWLLALCLSILTIDILYQDHIQNILFFDSTGMNLVHSKTYSPLVLFLKL